MHRFATALSLCIAAASAQAGIEVRFIESAPTDRFVITNTGGCDQGPLEVTIDLSNSAGKLIFDTTATGAGVEVFQPFRQSDETIALKGGTVSDGDQTIGLALSGLPAGGTTGFTIDVDDTLKNSALGQIRVSGSEISGATVRVTSSNNSAHAATFDGTATARLTSLSCI